MREWEEWIKSADGTGLYARAAVPRAARAAVVIIHGLCEHQGRYDHVAEGLSRAGYAVWRFDLRGHGRSEGRRAFYPGFREMIADLRAVTDRVEREFKELPLFLLGHSMGGMIAALYATEYPGRADGVVLAGARTRFSHSDWEAVLPLDEAEDTYHAAGFGEGLCTDLRVVEAYRLDSLVEKRFTTGIRNSCWRGVEWLKQHSKEFVSPVLILHGKEDPVVSFEESEEFYREIGSGDRTLKLYEGLRHEILNEPCRDEIIGEIIGWMDRRVPVAAAGLKEKRVI